MSKIFDVNYFEKCEKPVDEVLRETLIILNELYTSKDDYRIEFDSWEWGLTISASLPQSKTDSVVSISIHGNRRTDPYDDWMIPYSWTGYIDGRPIEDDKIEEYERRNKELERPVDEEWQVLLSKLCEYAKKVADKRFWTMRGVFSNQYSSFYNDDVVDAVKKIMSAYTGDLPTSKALMDRLKDETVKAVYIDEINLILAHTDKNGYMVFDPEYDKFHKHKKTSVLFCENALENDLRFEENHWWVDKLIGLASQVPDIDPQKSNKKG